MLDQYEDLDKNALLEFIRRFSNQIYSYDEIVVECDYPPPYPRQIESKDFAFSGGVRLILGARFYGKSDYITVLGTIEHLLLNKKILILTHGDDRAMQICREISRCLGKLGIEKIIDNATTIRFPHTIGKDDNLSCKTIGTTGLRGLHPDYIIFDDPVTPEASSAADRRRTKIIYDESLKLTNNVIVIGQPVHKLDLYCTIRGKIDTLELPHGSIPELDQDLDALRIAQVEEGSIQASYFLNIQDSQSLPFNDLATYIGFPDDGAVAFIDPSFKGGDYTALSIVTTYFSNIVVVGFCYKRAWDDVIDEIVNKLINYKVGRVGFESNSLGNLPIKMLGPVLSTHNIYLTNWNSNKKKHQRIMNAGVFSNKIMLSSECDAIYNKQVREYEDGVEHDDAPDSLASCLMWLNLI